MKKRAHILICLQRGNHRSCQSPRHKCSYITLCSVLKETATEAVSRQDTTAVVLHVLLTLVVLSAPVRVDVFFETCKKECYNKGRPEISDGFGGGLGLVWYLSQDHVSQDPLPSGRGGETPRETSDLAWETSDNSIQFNSTLSPPCLHKPGALISFSRHSG